MQKYTLTMRVMHWIMGLLIITLLCVGLWMTGLPDEQKGFVYGMHKSFGLLVLLLLIVRLTTRAKSEVPALPKEITYYYAKLSAGVIFLLYICMLAQPVSGFLMSDFSGYPVYFFGLHVPSIVEKNAELGKLFVSIHRYLGFTIIGLLVLHVGGWLKHYLFEKVNLFKRIW